MILPAKDSKHRLPAMLSLYAIALNTVLATAKITGGILGSSSALIVDGIESLLDIVSSSISYAGVRVASRPPDANHPHGHGKAETLAGLLIAFMMIVAAVILTKSSIEAIVNPGAVPAWYTILVLLLVLVIKEAMYRYTNYIGEETGSVALSADALHHRSDAITSLMVLPGVCLAVYGGSEFAFADGVGALIACGFIYWNGIRFAWNSGRELIDTRVSNESEDLIRKEARGIPGVLDVEKCLLRKSGMYLLVDMHVCVDARLSVAEGHTIAHRVKDHILALVEIEVQDVLVHIEPYYSDGVGTCKPEGSGVSGTTVSGFSTTDDTVS